jgi:hypothetical protein
MSSPEMIGLEGWSSRMCHKGKLLTCNLYILGLSSQLSLLISLVISMLWTSINRGMQSSKASELAVSLIHSAEEFAHTRSWTLNLLGAWHYVRGITRYANQHLNHYTKRVQCQAQLDILVGSIYTVGTSPDRYLMQVPRMLTCTTTFCCMVWSLRRTGVSRGAPWCLGQGTNISKTITIIGSELGAATAGAFHPRTKGHLQDVVCWVVCSRDTMYSLAIISKLLATWLGEVFGQRN